MTDLLSSSPAASGGARVYTFWALSRSLGWTFLELSFQHWTSLPGKQIAQPPGAPGEITERALFGVDASDTRELVRQSRQNPAKLIEKWCGEGDLFSCTALKARKLYASRRAKSSKSATKTKSSHTFSHTGRFGVAAGSRGTRS